MLLELCLFAKKMKLLTKADSYGNENLYENGPNPFFVFVFLNLMGTRMVQIRVAKSV